MRLALRRDDHQPPRVGHLILGLWALTVAVAAIGFGFGWRGYLALRATEPLALGATGPLVAHGRSDLAIAAMVGLGLIVALAVLTCVLMARLQRMAVANGGSRSAAPAGSTSGIVSHRTWEARLVVELSQSRRLGYPLTVVVLEINKFKRYVARYGKSAGEGLLSEFASAAAQSLRGADLLTRFGHHQFALLLPGCPVHQASALLERLQAIVPAGQSFAAGVAAWHWRESSSTLIERAFDALARARAERAAAVEVAPGLPTNVDRPARRLEISTAV